MPQAPTLYRHPSFTDRVSSPLIAGLVLLVGLSLPSSANASDACTVLTAGNHRPSDAALVMDTEVAEFNGLEICFQAYETELAPRDVISHYRNLWSDRSGVLDEWQPESGQRQLSLRSLERSVQVTAFSSGRGSAVQLSEIQMPPAGTEPAIAPEVRIPGLEPIQDLRHEEARTISLISQRPPAVALARITDWLQMQGYESRPVPSDLPSPDRPMKTRLFEGQPGDPRLYVAVDHGAQGSQAHILFLPGQ